MINRYYRFIRKTRRDFCKAAFGFNPEERGELICIRNLLIISVGHSDGLPWKLKIVRGGRRLSWVKYLVYNIYVRLKVIGYIFIKNLCVFIKEIYVSIKYN